LKSEARRGEGDVLYITPIRLTSNVLSSGFEGFASWILASRSPFCVMPAFAKTISMCPCSAITFSKAAAWLSHEETSHCEKDRLAVGYSVRSWLRIAVLSVRSRMVMWVFALGAK
jgi:hypothetical protein